MIFRKPSDHLDFSKARRAGRSSRSGKRVPSRLRRKRSLKIESLEERLALTTLFWQGDLSNDWNTAGNWEQNEVPDNNDVLVFDTGTPDFNSFAPNNDIGGLTGIEIQIDDNDAGFDFTITGNSVGLAANGIWHSGSNVTETVINIDLR